MIRLPKNIKSIIAKFESEGYVCFAVGGALRDILAGKEPQDWDLAVDAGIDEMLRIFPGAVVINEELSVVRLNVSGHVDIARLREEIYGKNSCGTPVEVIFTGSIKDDLKRRDFTVNAMAYSASDGLIDPYGGVDDVRSKSLRMVGEPKVRLEEDPGRILRAIRLVAEGGYSFCDSLQQAISEKSNLIVHISKDRIRDEFIRIVSGENAVKALEAAEKTGALKWITGIDKLPSLCRFHKISLENPGKLLPLCVFYRSYPEEDAVKAVEYLNYGGKDTKLLKGAVKMGNRLMKIKDKVGLKEFIAEYGFEFYRLMEDVMKVEAGSDKKLEELCRVRLETAAEIQNNGEPLRVEDLAINGDDIKKLGAAGKTVGQMLELLAAQVRENPEINDRKKLIKMAEEMIKWNLK